MNVRKVIGTALRRVDLDGFRRWGEALTYDIEGKAYALARRVDPRDPLEGWSNLGYVSEDGVDLDAWSNEVMKPMQDAINDSIRRLAEQMEIPQMFIAPDSPLSGDAWRELQPKVVWRTPEPVDIDGVKDVVRKAYEDGTALTPQVMRNFPEVTISREDLEFNPPSPAADWTSYVLQMSRAKAAEREGTMADWLDDVGTVVPGFDSDAARQIIAERDRFLP